MKNQSYHLNRFHPLATVAGRHCASHSGALIGGIACGACWELAIRDDERVVVEHDLPRDLQPDPEYVDEIAVELACYGDPVELTAAEFEVAVSRLRARRMSIAQVSRLLNVSYETVSRTVRQSPAALAGVAA